MTSDAAERAAGPRHHGADRREALWRIRVGRRRGIGTAHAKGSRMRQYDLELPS
ncbi:hypothetical protein [Roseitranquillus sediminis]|uniref:hypothetical protein n=1 Tax=Roseitranquillus sediminis TaxID=2809051 RepID=UPI001D0CCB5C|nr:hypothetical protein [Roseitranquillus sediminis]MBM9593085.1 hypothetical protein [Roseitranquillus sediminis]